MKTHAFAYKATVMDEQIISCYGEIASEVNAPRINGSDYEQDCDHRFQGNVDNDWFFKELHADQGSTEDSPPIVKVYERLFDNGVEEHRQLLIVNNGVYVPATGVPSFPDPSSSSKKKVVAFDSLSVSNTTNPFSLLIQSLTEQFNLSKLGVNLWHWERATAHWSAIQTHLEELEQWKGDSPSKKIRVIFVGSDVGGSVAILQGALLMNLSSPVGVFTHQSEVFAFNPHKSYTKKAAGFFSQSLELLRERHKWHIMVPNGDPVSASPNLRQ